MAAVCPMCRKQVREGAAFCPACGYLMDQSVEMPAEAEEPYRADERFMKGCRLAKEGNPSAFEEWIAFVRSSDPQTIGKALKDIQDMSVSYVHEYTYEGNLDDLKVLTRLSLEIDRRTGGDGRLVHGITASLSKTDALDPNIAMALFCIAERLSDDQAVRMTSPMKIIDHLRFTADAMEGFESEPSWDESDIQVVEDYRGFCRTMMARIQESDATGEGGDPETLYHEAKDAWKHACGALLNVKEKRARFEEAADRYVRSILVNDDRRRGIPIRYIRPSALASEEIQ